VEQQEAQQEEQLEPQLEERSVAGWDLQRLVKGLDSEPAQAQGGAKIRFPWNAAAAASARAVERSRRG
jgi:hypothetical protein